MKVKRFLNIEAINTTASENMNCLCVAIVEKDGDFKNYNCLVLSNHTVEGKTITEPWFVEPVKLILKTGQSLQEFIDKEDLFFKKAQL